MHSLLEDYLSEVAAHLSALPVKQRNEELREMRAHLGNAVIVSRELGQPEEEAAQSIITQFGTPQELSGNVVWAWQRGLARDRRSFLGAAVTTLLMVCLGFLFMNFSYGFLGSLLPLSFGASFIVKHPNFGMAFVQGTLLADFGLAGLAAGALFPKRALWGVCLGLALFWIGFALVDGVGQLQALVSVEGLTHQGRGGWILAAIVSAWAGSRLRLTGGKCRRLARV